jgi:sugar phosphate isomerase/epimerase
VTEPNDAPIVGVQLYTLREVSDRVEDVLDLVASAGADAVETVGHHGLDAPALRDALERRGLRAVSTHLQLAALEADLDAEVAFARTVGIGTLVVPWLPPAERPTDRDGWTSLGTRLARLGARVRDAGLRLAYHNHDFELTDVEGRTGLAWLLDAADPAVLDVELDLAWVARAGGDPTAVLRRWRERTRLLHAKDLAPAGSGSDEDGWATVGQGTLPWPALLELASEVGVEAWLLEHDRPADPARTVREGCAYLLDRRSRAA